MQQTNSSNSPPLFVLILKFINYWIYCFNTGTFIKCYLIPGSVFIPYTRAPSQNRNTYYLRSTQKCLPLLYSLNWKIHQRLTCLYYCTYIFWQKQKLISNEIKMHCYKILIAVLTPFEIKWCFIRMWYLISWNQKQNLKTKTTNFTDMIM